MLCNAGEHNLVPCQPKNETHAFAAMGVNFHVIKMTQSYIIWIGESQGYKFFCTS